jgi:ABC-type multidrug transport system fused ATPase/permease subunit
MKDKIHTHDVVGGNVLFVGLSVTLSAIHFKRPPPSRQNENRHFRFCAGHDHHLSSIITIFVVFSFAQYYDCTFIFNMSKRYNEKRSKLAAAAVERELDQGYGKEDFETNAAKDVRAAAMGEGDEELFEKKLSKEEKKALAKAKREAKKKKKDGDKGGMSKNASSGDVKEFDNDTTPPPSEAGTPILLDADAQVEDKREAALEQLSRDNIIVTYESRKGALHANARNINVSGVTVTFHGKPLIEETDLVINYGNRYGFIGPNGSGKSTIMKAIAARAVPIPENLVRRR